MAQQSLSFLGTHKNRDYIHAGLSQDPSQEYPPSGLLMEIEQLQLPLHPTHMEFLAEKSAQARAL
jgi:hypothetical protein